MKQETVEEKVNNLRVALVQLATQQPHMVVYAEAALGELTGYLSGEQRERYEGIIGRVKDLFQYLTDNPRTPWDSTVGEIGNNCSLIIEEVTRFNLETSHQSQVQQLKSKIEEKDTKIIELTELEKSGPIIAIPKYEETLKKLKELQKLLLEQLGSTRPVHDFKKTMDGITTGMERIILSPILENIQVPEEDRIFLGKTYTVRDLIREEKPDSQLDESKEKDRTVVSALRRYGLDLERYLINKSQRT